MLTLQKISGPEQAGEHPHTKSRPASFSSIIKVSPTGGTGGRGRRLGRRQGASTSRLGTRTRASAGRHGRQADEHARAGALLASGAPAVAGLWNEGCFADGRGVMFAGLLHETWAAASRKARRVPQFHLM